MTPDAMTSGAAVPAAAEAPVPAMPAAAEAPVPAMPAAAEAPVPAMPAAAEAAAEAAAPVATPTPAATPAATAAPAPAASAPGWTRICRVDDLLVERGAAALVGDRQIALFRTYDGRIYATDQVDPFSGAAILSRGIVGDRGGVPTVASPMYKQVFDLRTGTCLDTQGKEPLSVRVHPVAVTDGEVFVKIDTSAGDAEGENR